jgi:hypothetical protein
MSLGFKSIIGRNVIFDNPGMKSDQRGNSFTSMRLKKFQELIKMNTTWKVDILIKMLWPLKSPMPGWSVLMQMV